MEVPGRGEWRPVIFYTIAVRRVLPLFIDGTAQAAQATTRKEKHTKLEEVNMDNYGILSLAPALIAVILAFHYEEKPISPSCAVFWWVCSSPVEDLLFGFTGIIECSGRMPISSGSSVSRCSSVSWWPSSEVGAISAVASSSMKLHASPPGSLRSWRCARRADLLLRLLLPPVRG